MACEELQIHCAPCTSIQISVFKSNGVIPPTADKCGLITKSDVERLISYLHMADLMDKDKENIAVGGDAASCSRTVQRKRSRDSSASTPTKAISASSQELSVTTETSEYNPLLKKARNDSSLETESSKLDVLSYTKHESISESNLCMEVTPSTVSQQVDTSLEPDKMVSIVCYSM